MRKEERSDSRPPVRAVVLDWAGTAVDYGCLGPAAVFVEVFKRRGVEVTIAEAREPMGLMKKDHLRAMGAMPAVAARSLDMVWAGDIMYERRFVTPVSDFLDYSVARDGVVWVAEPGRNVYATFRETLGARGWTTRCARTMQVDALYRQAERVTVYLWEMRPPHT